MSELFSIRRENDYLRQELGSEHGQQRYRWAWSADLLMPMILVDDDGKIIYDYICGCGKNLAVHAADCTTFTLPKAQWEVRSLVPRLKDQWVLCRWQAPEASRDDWDSSFPGQPYPTSGYLIPVGDAEKCVCIPAGQIPYRATTDLCIQSLRDHFSKTGAQRNAETKEKWAADEEKELATLELRCKDAFPVHEGWPGEKHEWSHGGMPEVDSPNLKGEVTLA